MVKRITDVQNSPKYLENSIRRLEIFSDKRLRTRDDVFIALVEHQHALVPEQTHILMRYVKEPTDG